MAKQRQREWRNKAGSPETKDGSSIAADGVSENRHNLLLKNNSSTIPPRREQLAVSQVHVEGGNSATSNVGRGSPPPAQNQYQLAMGEALARHEDSLMRVQELRKLQE